MTKTEFLAGTPFHHFRESKHRPYVFKPNSKPDYSRIENDPVGYLNCFGSTEANVSRVTENYFDAYTCICHKVVRVRIYFKDLHI